MSRTMKPWLFVFLGFCTSSSLATEAWLAEEVSVAEPTELHTVASADGSEVVWSEFIGEIKSADANAAVTAIQVEERDGKRIRGVLTRLETAVSADEIYITEASLSSLRNELQEIEYTRKFDIECEAKNRCVHGIARCRPSQTVRQAYCPGRYSTANSEEGFVLSTPRSTFSFPSIGAAQFDILLSGAVQLFE